jgi:hypothetical protein
VQVAPREPARGSTGQSARRLTGGLMGQSQSAGAGGEQLAPGERPREGAGHRGAASSAGLQACAGEKTRRRGDRG